ncbi:RNA-binding cell elongation regulator Jag/EloR [Paenibacillus thermotolerans]|uniref:RNA-binding cell elongation regulator Jag/EloR n=1 Tax=Paenibacillus thermotolerans TaxID=3027807 RepID=UPI002368A5FD|nr:MULTISPECIES: RNA-binding cell elongation regulator Jag/EloR [unclassified Paenibacillus]
MTKRVFTGKTVQEAVRRGLEQLGVTEDHVRVTVLEQPKKALLGLIGGRDAEVQLEVIEAAEPSPEAAISEAPAAAAEPSTDPIEDTVAYLGELLRAMGLEAGVSNRKDKEGNVILDVAGKDLGIIIGRRGQTLDALQLILNVYANRYSDGHVRIILDAEQFRERRKKTLEDLSLRLANQVVRTRREVVLEPMTAQERRIIHYQLQNHPKVQTYSKGEEPNRRIVIALK